MDSPNSLRRDVRVIGLAGIAHGCSHFLQLALPPLFPLRRAVVDASWPRFGRAIGTVIRVRRAAVAA